MSENKRRDLSSQIEQLQESSVLRDQSLIPVIFKTLYNKDVHPIVSEGFIQKSQERYNAAWLGRELIQNFIDANPVHAQSLDGVHFQMEDLPQHEGAEKDRKRFTITGDWVFKKPTGLISPHSEKTSAHETAGGNGIGLKQTALRLLRDFHVQRFEIIGEGWEVAYAMTNKDELNQELQAAAQDQTQPAATIDHNWLVAELSKNKNKGINSYVIETDHPEIISVMGDLSRLGVSKENPFLQNPDFENEHGAIKWIFPDEKDASEQEGALFINGQMMNYQNEGTTSRDYWQGPEFVTIRLNDVRYQMSIDRPPVRSYVLQTYLSDLVGSMTKEQLIEQIQRSEPIWTTQADDGSSYEKKGCFTLIDTLIRFLEIRYKNPKSIYQQYFGDKQYVATDSGMSDQDKLDLAEKGFILCPGSFETIGMPRASSKLDRTRQLKNQEPTDPGYSLKKIAKESGIEVYGEEFDENMNEKAFFQLMVDRLGSVTSQFKEVADHPNTFRAELSVSIPDSLLFHPLPRPKKNDASQSLVYFLRGMIQCGLEDGFFQNVHTTQDGYFSNYKLKDDDTTGQTSLLVRHIENKGSSGVSIEFEVTPERVEVVKSALANTSESKKPNPVANSLPEEGKETILALIKSAFSGSKSSSRKETKPVNVNTLPKNKPQSSTASHWDRLRKFAPVASLIAVFGIAIERNPDIVLDPASVVAEYKDDVKLFFDRIDAVKEIPDLQEILDKLRKFQGNKNEGLTGSPLNDQYKKWKSSKDFYGKLGGEKAGYIGKNTLFEILSKFNNTKVKSKKRLKNLLLHANCNR